MASKRDFVPPKKTKEVRQTEKFIQNEKTQDKINLTTRARIGSSLPSIFSIILIFLIVVMLYRVTNSSTIPTFESLLTTLSNLEVVKIDFSLGLSNVLPDWLGWLGTLWDIVSFALNGILVLIQYAFHIVAWIFA